MIIKSWEDVDNALMEIRSLKNELDQSIIETDKKVLPLQKKINEIQEKSAARNESKAKKLFELEEQIESFAWKNLEAGTSKKLGYGVVQIRKGKPKLDLIDDAKTVLEKVKKAFRRRYVRITEALNKTAVMDDYRKEKLDDEQLRELGMKVVSEPSFSYKVG